jgi:hypothetical protein
MSSPSATDRNRAGRDVSAVNGYGCGSPAVRMGWVGLWCSDRDSGLLLGAVLHRPAARGVGGRTAEQLSKILEGRAAQVSARRRRQDCLPSLEQLIVYRPWSNWNHVGTSCLGHVANDDLAAP